MLFWNQMFIEPPNAGEAEMSLWNGKAIGDRFAAYIGELTKVVGHADRAGPLRDYCSGLLVTEGRRGRGFRRSTRNSCISPPIRRGRMRQCWPRCVSW